MAVFWRDDLDEQTETTKVSSVVLFNSTSSCSRQTSSEKTPNPSTEEELVEELRRRVG